MVASTSRIYLNSSFNGILFVIVIMAYTNFVMLLEEDEMGVTCSTHREVEECLLGFGGKASRRETTRKT
jgi:hypothetical protein